MHSYPSLSLPRNAAECARSGLRAGAAGKEHCSNPHAFGNGVDTIDARKLKCFARTGGPVNLDGPGVECIAKAEVGPLVVGGNVASTAHDVFPLAHAVSGEEHRRADCIARASGTADQLQLNPVMVIRVNIPEQYR